MIFPEFYPIVSLLGKECKLKVHVQFTCCVNEIKWNYPDNIYLLKVMNRNTRKRCEICSKLTVRTPEQRH